MMRTASLEVLSMENRMLDAHEAMYLRIRHLRMREHDRHKNHQVIKEINAHDAGSVFTAASRADLFALAEIITNYESRGKKRSPQADRRQSVHHETADPVSLVPRPPKNSRLALKHEQSYLRRSRKAPAMDVHTLTKMVKSSPALAQMIQTRHCILVIGSASHSNVDKLLKSKLLPQFYRACDPEQLNLSYLSYSKVDAMQDSLLLASYLYRL